MGQYDNYIFNHTTALKNRYEKEDINELNLKAVYRSLRRLQKVYNIPASDMAAGKHKNRIIGDPLDGKCRFTLQPLFLQERLG